MKDMNNKKIIHGQFYTIGNPFLFEPFLSWFNIVYSKIQNKNILEPFSGANHIIKLVEEATEQSYNWNCFDVDPNTKFSKTTLHPITIQDVLLNFPKNYELILTNPPYLAKNSATRKSIKFKYNTQYNDLYKYCLSVMLENCDYIGAIIPETFIIQSEKELKERLELVISLKGKFFDDTDCPVCLALFSKDKTDDFKIYSNNDFIGYYNELYNNYNINPIEKYSLKFNDPKGEISLISVDNHIEESICFQKGELIPSERIKNSSRTFSRIKLPFDILHEAQLEAIINESNNLVSDYRKNTQDVFLASFKGLRKDNKYRRRLDFKIARNILNQAIFNVLNESNHI